MPSLNRLLLLATCAVATTGACAQATSSSVNVFGIVDIGAGRYQLAGRPSDLQVVSSPLITSRLGFAGSEDLGGGLRANFNLAHLMRPDTGEAGRFTGDSFWSSRATVGLSGAFGQVNLGRMNSPLFFALLRFDPHELAPTGPVFLHTFPGGQPLTAPQLTPDSAINNGIQYASPVIAGFSASLHAGTAEIADSHRGRVGYAFNYTQDALSLSVAGDVITAPVPAGESRQTAVMGAASYNFQVVKVAAIYQRHVQKTLDNDYRIVTLGATIPVGPHKILATWTRTDLDTATGTDPDRSSVALTYSHTLSKRTDVYVHALHDQVSNASNDGNSLLAGIRHRF